MGRLAPTNDDPLTGIVPPKTITFIGGPLCGRVLDNEGPANLDEQFPDWVKPTGEDHYYWNLDSFGAPGWMVEKPYTDAFDKVFLYCTAYFEECPGCE